MAPGRSRSGGEAIFRDGRVVFAADAGISGSAAKPDVVDHVEPRAAPRRRPRGSGSRSTRRRRPRSTPASRSRCRADPTPVRPRARLSPCWPIRARRRRCRRPRRSAPRRRTRRPRRVVVHARVVRRLRGDVEYAHDPRRVVVADLEPAASTFHTYAHHERERYKRDECTKWTNGAGGRDRR